MPLTHCVLVRFPKRALERRLSLRIGLRVTALLLATVAAAPCVAIREPAEDWRAEWIGVIGGSKQNSWICYRKQLDVTLPPESVVARIACDSKYWLWINSELAVFEGQLKRGPTPHDTYFDTVELAPYLKQGRNTIAVLMCHFGRHGYSHNSSGRAALLFEADVNGLPLVSDESWRVRVHPAFGETDPPLDNVRLPEANLRFDARHDIGGWQAPTYDDSGWGPPTLYGRAPCAPWNKLYRRPIPHWKNSGLIDYAGVEETLLDDSKRMLAGQLPFNCQVSPYFKVDAPAGRVIEIYSDTYDVYGKQRLVETHRHEYVTRKGVQEFELPAWINGHQVRHVIPNDVKVLELKYRETGYDTEFAGRFECDDPALNQLWEESRRTLYVTMRDTYMDCPDRERAQWWGDAVNELGEAFYAFEPRRAALLARKGIYELTRWQRANGTLYSPVPSGVRRPGIEFPIDGSWDQELPRQMLASVGWYGFWTYYWYSDDKTTVVDAYPAVKRYLDLWEIGDDGLAKHRTGEWDWTDWGEHRDIAVVENAWLYLALKAACEMAALADRPEDVAGYRTRMDSIEANFNRRFWRGDAYRSPEHQGETDDRANAMAVVAGLANPADYSAITAVLERERHASPYMEKYVLEALLQMRRPDVAFERMLLRYDAMLADDKTTLWEFFDELVLPGYGNMGRGTCNHAWSGGPLTILSQYVAGISPTSPGFKEYQVLPQPGRLTRVAATTPTQYGSIRLAISRSDGAPFVLSLASPPDTLATVGIPIEHVSAGATIDVNGEPVWKAGQSMDAHPSVRFAGADGEFARFTAPPGDWTFSVSPATP